MFFLFSDVVQVNLLGVMHGTKLAIDHLSKGGLVINISSLAGIFNLPIVPTYSATKAAIINYTRYFYWIDLPFDLRKPISTVSR